MKILIAGDLVPINSNEDLFAKGSCKKAFSDFDELLDTSDLFIANLECPLTTHEEKISKSGSSLKASPNAITGISQLNVNLLSLANNHIGDYCEAGVKDTIAILKEHDIGIIGAGNNPEDARTPYIFNKDGMSAGVLSYADYEFGMAEAGKPGANPFSFINAYNDIKSLKTKVDYLIILLHDGKENYPYPSPELQQICKHLIDLGSNIVVCQHSHLIGAVEEYQLGTIIYGQGNFVFDYRNNRTSGWSNGFFIEIKLEKKNTIIDLLPFKQNYPGVSKLNKEEKKLFFSVINERANKLTNKNFVKSSWENFILAQKPNYFSSAFGHNLFLSKLLKKTGIFNYLISNKVALIVLNFLRSRVHRESFISILENRIKKTK